jgi:hypothetical protein
MVNKTETHKLLATEMDYIRRSARISRMDTIRNETIRTKMGIWKGILRETLEQQLKLYGHVMRMEDCRIAGQVAEWNPQGKKETQQTSQHIERWN